MKNEDRVVELLAEMLRKQDRHEEQLHLHEKILKKLVEGQVKLVEGQEKLVEGQEKLVEGQERLIKEFHRMNDHLLTRQDRTEERLLILENRVFKN